MSTFETGNELAILAASRNINWQDQAAYTPLAAGVETSGAPATAAAGIELSNVVKALISVAVREAVHQRRARVTVPVHDGATAYALIIAGTTVTHSVGGDTRADQAIRGLVTLVNGSGPLAGVVTATALNAAGEDVTSVPYDATDSDTVAATAAVTAFIQGATEGHWTFNGTATGGTGTIGLIADPQTCSARVYCTRKLASGSSEWTLVPNGTLALDRRGFTDRFTVNGLKRLYVEIYDIAASGDGADVRYAPAVRIGPAILE